MKTLSYPTKQGRHTRRTLQGSRSAGYARKGRSDCKVLSVKRNDLLAKYVLPPILLIGLVFPSQAQEKPQSRIDSVFYHTFQSKEMQDFEALVKQLDREDSQSHNPYTLYWKSYARYRAAIAKLEIGNGTSEEKQARKQASRYLEEAFTALERSPDKGSEEYALMAHIRNYSIACAPKLKIPSLSNMVGRYGELALKADPKNLRALLALGTRDYYTPTMYGGGTRCESYFQQALALEDQYDNHPYAPSWGRNEVYYYLIRFYMKQNKTHAATLLEEALHLFPEDPRLLSLSKFL